jgi:prepilin-type N-terminal cleavage/methylation domain-containing protein
MKITLEKTGFTLIELMTSISIFAVIMTISMGSILGIFDANRKSEALKTVMDNLNFTIETMSREMRFGKNYHCSSSVPLTNPTECYSGNDNFVSFLSSDGKQTVYRLNNTSIQKSTDGGSTYVDVTAPEVTINKLGFVVVGSPALDNMQPRIFIQIKGYAGSKSTIQSNFTLQTLVTQRIRDN